MHNRVRSEKNADWTQLNSTSREDRIRNSEEYKAKYNSIFNWLSELDERDGNKDGYISQEVFDECLGIYKGVEACHQFEEEVVESETYVKGNRKPKKGDYKTRTVYKGISVELQARYMTDRQFGL